MSVKDIVNRSNVNLTNCDQEPIHIPGSVQPHGCLLAVDLGSLKIKFCSGNADEIFEGPGHEQLLDKSVLDFMTPEDARLISDLSNLSALKTLSLKLSFGKEAFECMAHISGNYLILESDKKDTTVERPDILELSKEFVSYIEETHTLNELCHRVAEGTRKITGYDRVMIYRFDEQYNGEVISESKSEHLESFLGLHYPHTDIPVQARELYIRNQLRIIVDVNYVPVPIFTTIQEAGNQTLDLSISALRSVSPIHVQYLHNMGVGATLTISLMHKQKLWGLVACHHYSPKYLSYETRMAAKLLGHFITSQIDTRLLNEEYKTAREVNEAVDRLSSEKPALNRDSFKKIVADPRLLAVCNASGVSILLNDMVYTGGVTPAGEEIKRLAGILADHSVHGGFFTNSIIRQLPELQFICENLPGVNYISLDKASPDCIIWYRHETVREVNWAGDPAKSIEKDQNGLSPRKSFELWRETVKHQSKPWLKSELSAAAAYANILEKHISAVLLAEEEEKQREMARILRQTNAELENINWISTHDLQEPLRKIQLVSSMLMNDKKNGLTPDVNEKIRKMNQFAARMQTLIKDILKYTQLNYNNSALEPINLDVLLEDVRTEIADILEEKQGSLVTGELPVIKGIPFLIRQLFLNLIYNSLKFSSSERAPEIRISLHENSTGPVPEGMTLPLSDYFLVQYKDNGIGFDPSFNDTVFKIFTRLHGAEAYSGSGIGLSLCRKIISSHNGFITASGVSGKGATFSLYFPKPETAF